MRARIERGPLSQMSAATFLITLAVFGVHALAGRRSLPILALLVPVLAMATVQRNRDYQSKVTVWSDIARKLPEHERWERLS